MVFCGTRDTDYEERCEARAEAENEALQIEKHFTDINDAKAELERRMYEVIQDRAKQRAKSLEKHQTMDVYTDEASYKYDLGYNKGEVAGFEEGYVVGAMSIEPELEKAKEMIKEFMRISVASVEEYEPEFSELIGKAEQFLKEAE